MNINNHGILRGHLTKAPLVFVNKDGSRKVILNIGVQDNFKSKSADGTMERATQFVTAEAFIPASQTSLGPYDYMYKGSLVGLSTQLRSSVFEKDGKTQYQVTVAIQSVDLSGDNKERSAELKARHESELAVAAGMAAEVATEQAPVPAKDLSSDTLPFE